MKTPRPQIDGFLALLLLVLTPFIAVALGRLVAALQIGGVAYGGLFGGIITVAFSIGFAISGLRQANFWGRICSGLCLLAIIILPLLFALP